MQRSLLVGCVSTDARAGIVRGTASKASQEAFQKHRRCMGMGHCPVVCGRANAGSAAEVFIEAVYAREIFVHRSVLCKGDFSREPHAGCTEIVLQKRSTGWCAGIVVS